MDKEKLDKNLIMFIFRRRNLSNDWKSDTRWMASWEMMPESIKVFKKSGSTGLDNRSCWLKFIDFIARTTKRTTEYLLYLKNEKIFNYSSNLLFFSCKNDTPEPLPDSKEYSLPTVIQLALADFLIIRCIQREWVFFNPCNC